MKILCEQKLLRTGGALGGASRIKGLTSILGGILLLALLHNPVETLGATLPGSSSVPLAWDISPSPGVTGYRVYYGAASGSYTNSVVVGNATAITIQGLASGILYYFAVAAYNASGQESDFSNRLSYAVPADLPTAQIGVAPNRQVILAVTGQAGHTFEILATQTFITWTVIGTVTVGAGGSLNFTDANAASLPRRFYRIREKL